MFRSEKGRGSLLFAEVDVAEVDMRMRGVHLDAAEHRAVREIRYGRRILIGDGACQFR